MAKFSDNEGRLWDIQLTVGAMKRVKRLADIDLGACIAEGSLDDILNDIIKVGDMLYSLCEPQATKLGVTDEQFGELLGGDTLFRAIEAFAQAVVDFCPSHLREEIRTQMAVTMNPNPETSWKSATNSEALQE